MIGEQSGIGFLRKAIFDRGELAEQILELPALADDGVGEGLRLRLLGIDSGVAHGHETRPLDAGAVGQGGFEVTHVGLDLGKGPGQAPGHDVVAFLDRGIEGKGIARCHPNRRVRLLQRLRAGGGDREGPVLAFVLIVALPERLQRREHLQHHRDADVLVQPARQTVELALVGALADAELQAAAGKMVQQGGLAGQLDRVPIGRDHDPGAEADLVRVGGKMGQELEGARGNSHLQGVVLGCPNNVETALIGHLNHLGGVRHHVLHRGAGFHALQVDHQVEPHNCLLLMGKSLAGGPDPMPGGPPASLLRLGSATPHWPLFPVQRKLEKNSVLRNIFFMPNLRTRLPPVNSLIAFEASARLLSFTKAGEELLVSREAISRQIRILEDHMGSKLFLRQHRALVLTPEGASFHAVVRHNLEEIAQSARDLQRQTEPRKVTISATVALSTYWLTPRLPRYRDRYPETEIRVVVSDSLPHMSAEGIDIGLRYGDGNWPGTEAWHLFDIESFPLCSARYLENSAKLCEPADLAQHTLLNLDGAAHAAEDWKWWLEESGVAEPAPRQTLGFDNYVNVIQAALDHQGIALGFTGIADGVVARGDLLKPLGLSLSTGWAVYLVVPKGGGLSKEVRCFHNWVIEEAGKDSGPP